MRVALLYNSKHSVPRGPDSPPDALAEYDSDETISGLQSALLAGGHEVFPLEGDAGLPETLRHLQPDMCFNICEGLRGESRESQVPAILEMLGIPYTAAGVLANALSLDKGMCKTVWKAAGLPTAPFQVLRRPDELLAADLAFPLFVKPAREGSGMGINDRSVVRDERQLRDQVAWLVSTYRQPALVESFLPGREFTIGLVGNDRGICPVPADGLYDERGFIVFPALEIDVSEIEGAGGLYSSHIKSDKPLEPRYLCPAPIDAGLAGEMNGLAVRAFNAIDARDVARVDFRLDVDGLPCLLEINTLPGLNPRYSDIVFGAAGLGMSYEALVNEVLRAAAARYGMT